MSINTAGIGRVIVQKRNSNDFNEAELNVDNESF